MIDPTKDNPFASPVETQSLAERQADQTSKSILVIACVLTIETLLNVLILAAMLFLLLGTAGLALGVVSAVISFSVLIPYANFWRLGVLFYSMQLISHMFWIGTAVGFGEYDFLPILPLLFSALILVCLLHPLGRAYYFGSNSHQA
ncbi:hypothetical protein ACYFX5_15320 [Bremerella sp. T1]|uniref:hypothetical protein n=1 Tax=Bremerella sp. TYQ1 TaxID=3119568 RepID=UPI001CCA20B5|nr:hypothetical protein [Bremerella volcania]UBM34427.1 hypothetical protein LA756_17270 [Bremerella volcania]